MGLTLVLADGGEPDRRVRLHVVGVDQVGVVSEIGTEGGSEGCG